MARRALQVLVALVVGLFSFRFGLPGMILGGEAIADGTLVTPLMDSEVRFLSAIAFGVGVILLFAIRNIERHTTLLQLIAASVFLGGALRLVSMAVVGPPPVPIRVAIGLEMLVPIAVVLLSRVVSKQGDRPKPDLESVHGCRNAHRKINWSGGMGLEIVPVAWHSFWVGVG